MSRLRILWDSLLLLSPLTTPTLFPLWRGERHSAWSHICQRYPIPTEVAVAPGDLSSMPEWSTAEPVPMYSVSHTPAVRSARGPSSQSLGWEPFWVLLWKVLGGDQPPAVPAVRSGRVHGQGALGGRELPFSLEMSHGSVTRSGHSRPECSAAHTKPSAALAASWPLVACGACSRSIPSPLAPCCVASASLPGLRSLSHCASCSGRPWPPRSPADTLLSQR